MKKRILAAVLSAALLCGCGASAAASSSEAAATSETAASSEAAASAEPTEQTASEMPDEAETLDGLWQKMQGVWTCEYTELHFGDPATNDGRYVFSEVIRNTDAAIVPVEVTELVSEEDNVYELHAVAGFSDYTLWLMPDEAAGTLRFSVNDRVEEGDNAHTLDPSCGVMGVNESDGAAERIGAASYRVTANDGLVLRAGPGTDYAKITTIPYGTIVHETSEDGSEAYGVSAEMAEYYGCDPSEAERWLHTEYWSDKNCYDGWLCRDYLEWGGSADSAR